MKKDMLRHKNKVIMLLLLIATTLSCTDKRRTLQDLTPELLKKRTEVFNYSKNLVGDSLYWQVYNQMNDSIKIWADNNLGLYQYMKKDSTMTINWQVDSVLCFNSERDKVITAVLRQNLRTTSIGDGEWCFFGVKVNDNWWFFDGAEMALFRKYYQKDISQPLSFATLGLLATRYVYAGYLRRKWWFFGDYKINEDFFKGFYNKNEYGEATTGYGGCLDCKTQDEYYLYRVVKNWSEQEK